MASYPITSSHKRPRIIKDEPNSDEKEDNNSIQSIFQDPTAVMPIPRLNRPEPSSSEPKAKRGRPRKKPQTIPTSTPPTPTSIDSSAETQDQTKLDVSTNSTKTDSSADHVNSSTNEQADTQSSAGWEAMKEVSIKLSVITNQLRNSQTEQKERYAKIENLIQQQSSRFETSLSAIATQMSTMTAQLQQVLQSQQLLISSQHLLSSQIQMLAASNDLADRLRNPPPIGSSISPIVPVVSTATLSTPAAPPKESTTAVSAATPATPVAQPRISTTAVSAATPPTPIVPLTSIVPPTSVAPTTSVVSPKVIVPASSSTTFHNSNYPTRILPKNPQSNYSYVAPINDNSKKKASKSDKREKWINYDPHAKK